MSYQMNCTKEEALKIASKRMKFKVGYGFFIRPFLPSNEDMGFEGCSIVKVTKKEFLKAIEDLLRNLEKRGAKIRMTIPEVQCESFLI